MEDIDNVLGSYYNAIDPVSATVQGVGMGLQGVGQIATAFQKDEFQRKVLASCGRRPITGRDKKEKYNQCSARIEAEYRALLSRQSDVELMKAQAEIEKAKSLQGGNQGTNNTPLYIGIGAVAVIGLVILIMRR